MLHYKKLIDEVGISASIVSDIIDAHKNDRDRMFKLYKRYKADIDGPKIFKRETIEYEDFETGGNVRRLDDKVNNLLNNAFDVDIVDTKVGYMFGHPISYNVDNNNESLKNEIETFLLRNNADDVDSEYGKMAAICGISARLAYVDTEGNERIKNINPWEVVFIGEDVHEPEYSIRYYSVGETIYAEFYDDALIYFFKQEKGKQFTELEQQLHLFEYNPLFGVANNMELKGDAEKVLALIDAYDRTLSDASNEIEQYRLAYLILKGLGADEETLQNLKKTGVFELFEKDDDVKYLTKDINDQMIENHLNRLEQNILRFAKSVNFADEDFAGNASGIAMKFKVMALENKCITMERKFVSSLRYQFKVLFSAWASRKGFSKDDYLKVWFGFKRNLPVNILDEAQATTSLKGNVSEKTRLSLLTFVDDVQFELEEMTKDELLYGTKLEPLDGDEDESTRN
ncbi:phage portal protein [Paenisporosarcina cavernae]|uniref:Phage portal protein n=1 Tax=Paenisporosarcina cavernae TaxID=2320858 RepID=A0A385YPR7_9BACL|nr:phage portal protein [Paenisporosarcina cavernae]AYC28715.1 phage portal protein [Paenisporosarcina cavernae]